MKVEIDLPDDFLAWLERQPVADDGSLIGAPLADKLRWLLEPDIRYFLECAALKRHWALLKMLGVEHLIDLEDRDDDIPF